MPSLNKLLETICEFIHSIYNVECVFVRSASSYWTPALSNSRQPTLAVVLLHQLSSSALRKEVSGYKCCDVIVFGFSAFIRVCICIAVAYVLFIYFLTSCVASSRLQK